MKTDQQITEDVKDELRWEPLLGATGLSVSVRGGVVKISGNVTSYANLFIVQKAVWRVKGVKEVITDLGVILSHDDKRPDQTILENALNALKWHSSVPGERINIKVENGWVFLEGSVDWNYQKDAALNAIRSLQGVVGITDLIQIKPQPSVSQITSNIRKALERRSAYNAADIEIEAVGDRVILKGTAHSQQERRQAIQAAWSSPGVAMVDDQIMIEYD